MAKQRHPILCRHSQLSRGGRGLEFGDQLRCFAARGSPPGEVAGQDFGRCRQASCEVREGHRIAEHRVERFDTPPDDLPCPIVPELLVEPRKAGRRPRAPQLEVERAHRFQPSQPVFALAAHQRMFEQGEQSDGCQLFRGRAGDAQ
jgi:hypothetical protein